MCLSKTNAVFEFLLMVAPDSREFGPMAMFELLYFAAVTVGSVVALGALSRANWTQECLGPRPFDPRSVWTMSARAQARPDSVRPCLTMSRQA